MYSKINVYFKYIALTICIIMIIIIIIKVPNQNLQGPPLSMGCTNLTHIRRFESLSLWASKSVYFLIDKC